MALRSDLFREDTRLQACLVQDSAHVTPGPVGNFVIHIQPRAAVGARVLPA